MHASNKINPYYHILGATPEMSALKILIHYRIAKKRLKNADIHWEHPARQLVERAYFILSDPERRTHYDAYLRRNGITTYPRFINDDTPLNLIFAHDAD